MENEKWADLVYNGINFGDKFEISVTGMIRNKYNNTLVTRTLDGLKLYSFIYFKRNTYRIKIGEAQEQSGLERTVHDVKKDYNPFNAKQLEYLDKYYQRIPLEEPLD